MLAIIVVILTKQHFDRGEGTEVDGSVENLKCQDLGLKTRQQKSCGARWSLDES
jgi:hypothetical protein